MLKIHDVEQGSDEWLAARRGLITASEMSLVLTPTLKIANNEKTRAHVYELAAQRITGYVEPMYIGDDMLRGMNDEPIARDLYAAKYGTVDQCGFITNDEWGFTIGYSPDGLVGDDGLIEIKSRRQKYQVQTIIDNVLGDGKIPTDYMLQCQTGLLVTGRKWLDFISFCGGMPLIVMRVYPDLEIQDAIVKSSTVFEEKIKFAVDEFTDWTMGDVIMTERKELETL